MLRTVASAAAFLLIHGTRAFVPPCGGLVKSVLRRRHGVLPQQQQQLSAHCSAKSIRRGVTAITMAAPGSDVFALDFDGVICNSQGESSRSGFRALTRLWPDVVSKLLEAEGGKEGDDAPAWMLDKMRELRPIVETGYENILLVRLLIEEKLGTSPDVSDTLLETWGPEARDELAARYGLSREQLVEAFGQARDDWIETDFSGWLGANTFYEGVREAMSACEGEVYVVTTKQQRFASALLEHAGVKVPLERIFGLGTGPKAGVLAELAAKHSGSTLHFLEDRVETLEVVCADERLTEENGIKLYLCDWGFNTPSQRARGEQNPRVRLIGASDIADILAPGVQVSAVGGGRS